MRSSTPSPPRFRHLFAALMVSCLVIPAAKANGDLIAKKSNHSVAVSLDRLDKIVSDKGFTVFARIDHAAGASKVGKSLRPTQLLLFGNPKVGTALMSSAQAVGLELPIRVLAWEDSQGQVWLGYAPPSTLAQRHGITDREAVIAKMTAALDALTNAATK